ncbi:hypothetical protein [Nonomuraea dietziae]|uniref:hypothetical protein n=1 Tax=Nonomuraea dietziae TaxID=65515 RepID=UPI003CD0A213
MNGTRKAVYRMSSAQKLLYSPIAWNIFTRGTSATVGASMSPPRISAVIALLKGMVTLVRP